MKSVFKNLFIYVMMVVLPLLLPVLFMPFGINLVRYATANECSGEQISTGRSCIGRLTAEVVRTGADRVPRDVCDQYSCTTEHKDRHFMLVRLPDGKEQHVKANDTLEGFTPGEKIELYSWNGTFIRADDGRPDHDVALNAWRPGWMTLTLAGAVAAWLMAMHPLCKWAWFRRRRHVPKAITTRETVIANLAPIAVLGAIGFLLVYGITSNMFL